MNKKAQLGVLLGLSLPLAAFVLFANGLSGGEVLSFSGLWQDARNADPREAHQCRRANA